MRFTMEKFKVFMVREQDGAFIQSIEEMTRDQLPAGDVLIEVKYSSLNYKDALASKGVKGIARSYPHIPGIDASGIVVSSDDPTIKLGEEVLVTGYGLGVSTFGGYSKYIRVPRDWVVKCPRGLSLREAMIIGTAGFTAALSVYKLVNQGIKPDMGDILVTGATGGVGSVAVAILAKLGYNVYGASGKLTEKEYLLKLGAKDLIDRSTLDDQSGRPLLKGRFMGVIDTVGGNILATALKSTEYGGVVTACGNAMSHELPTTVFPFILKGVSLLGVDSVLCPKALREEVWQLLGSTWKIEHLEEVVNEVSLEELSEQIDLIFKGQLKGRTLVNLNK